MKKKISVCQENNNLLMDIYCDIDRKKNMLLTIIPKALYNTILSAYNKEKNENSYIIPTENPKNSFEEIEANDKYIYTPYLTQNTPNEGSIFYIYGQKGSGKSLIATELIKNYIKNNDDVNLYFICPTSFHDDVNLKNFKFKKQIFPDDLLEIYAQKDYLNEFKSSVVLIDDIDNYLTGKKSYKELVNQLLLCGRKYNIKSIFISHADSNAKYIKIDKETDIYFMRNDDNNIFNNRFLSVYCPYRNIKTIIKKEFADKNKHKYICINKITNTIFSNCKIMKIKSDY